MLTAIRNFYQKHFNRDKKLEFINQEMTRITSGQIRSDDQIWMAYLWCEYYFHHFNEPNIRLYEFKMQSHDGFSCDGFEVVFNLSNGLKYKIVMIMREVLLIDEVGTTIDNKVISFNTDPTFQIVRAVISMSHSLPITTN